jgi:hypothetical protein
MPATAKTAAMATSVQTEEMDPPETTEPQERTLAGRPTTGKLGLSASPVKMVTKVTLARPGWTAAMEDLFSQPEKARLLLVAPMESTTVLRPRRTAR